MHGQLVHFEVPATDSDRAKGFWGDLFGWEFVSFPFRETTFHAITGHEHVPGAIYDADKAGTGWNVYFETDDLDDTLAKVRELGGTVEKDKSAIPTVGWTATCLDSEGNSFDLIERDASAA